MANQEQAIKIFHSIISKISGSTFAATIGDFYRGESATLNAIEHLQQDHQTVFPSTLSDYLKISRPTITSTLRALEKKGFVKRELSNDDRRHIAVILTLEGKEQVKKKQCELNEWCDSMVHNLGEERFFSFLDTIDKALPYLSM